MVTHALPCLCGAHSPTVQSHGPCELLGTALWPVSPKRSGLPTVRNIAPPDPCGQDSPFPSLAPNPSEHLAMLSNEHLGGGGWLPPTKCPRQPMPGEGPGPVSGGPGVTLPPHTLAHPSPAGPSGWPSGWDGPHPFSFHTPSERGPEEARWAKSTCVPVAPAAPSHAHPEAQTCTWGGDREPQSLAVLMASANHSVLGPLLSPGTPSCPTAQGSATL